MTVSWIGGTAVEKREEGGRKKIDTIEAEGEGERR